MMDNKQDTLYCGVRKEKIKTAYPMNMGKSGTCEIDKGCRTLFSGKRPKQRYKGERIINKK